MCICRYYIINTIMINDEKNNEPKPRRNIVILERKLSSVLLQQTQTHNKGYLHSVF